MKGQIRFLCVFSFLALVFPGCIEPYTPPDITSDSNLVVEGYLNATDGSCYVKLHRTIPLNSNDPSEPVSDANVVIEDNNNRRYLSVPLGLGEYSFSNIPVDFTLKYRLVITDDGDEYTSDYVEVTQTPQIDTVSWRVEDDNVRFYVSTHNPETGTGYYLWRFNETWEYNSAFRSLYRLEDGIVSPRVSPDEIHYCWKTDPSTDIKISTTLALEQDVINDFLLRELSISARQFQIKYSIQVLQFSLTKDAYEYWSQVRDNTQATGSLFDVQPSRITGNIHNENGRPALGFFSASSVHEKRIFIQTNELPPRRIDRGYAYCAVDTLLLDDIPSYNGGRFLVNELVQFVELGPRFPPIEILLGYTTATSSCVDCRVAGGSIVRPDFWD